ncbi:MAG: lysylphosphatidylglycerol synthase transmembrane domain-containing protein [Candidatus Cloacimonadaceae bacterium]|nr:flippase-like domain-containing protein [Candidatus Cloacimonadota bacterium]MDY0127144.1 lysylphosphatidylglycerol synthase transmembrane domain-containing protein [Candidatus Cloacimonadaceae bacterium]MCB5255178.1 flippase-like domain-containing protein [Candidatus Cloacimonadota bacterium]MCK9177651.1 flippase-like domain-containing protein [Candidatus Cloacimonadota bacterium]MCK9242626.1 flippase-like domain-containing protein [Candidatus Cloacimonadota bacterium]
MNKRSLLFLIFGSIIGLGLILLWLNYVPISELKGYFTELSPFHVFLAATAYLAAYFVRSVRWNILLSQSYRIPVYDTWFYAMAGNLLNYLIPIRAGELVRAWFVKRNHGHSIVSSLPSIIIDKTFDTLAIVAVLILIPFLAIEISAGLWVLLALLAIVFVLSVGLLLLAAWYPQKVLTWLSLPLMVVPVRFREKVRGFIQLLIEGLNLFEHHPGKLILATLLTALGILLDGIYFYLIFEAFGIDFSFLLVLFGYTLINLSYALPQPPAQLGSNEWMMIIVFSLGFSLTKSSASAIMAFAHILTAILMGVVGGVAFAISGYEVIHMIFKGEKIDGKSD